MKKEQRTSRTHKGTFQLQNIHTSKTFSGAFVIINSNNNCLWFDGTSDKQLLLSNFLVCFLMVHASSMIFIIFDWLPRKVLTPDFCVLSSMP